MSRGGTDEGRWRRILFQREVISLGWLTVVIELLIVKRTNIMKKIITMILALLIVASSAFIAEARPANEGLSIERQTVGVQKQKKGAIRRTYAGGKYVWRKTRSGGRWVYRKVWVATKWTGKKTWRISKKVVRRGKRIIY